MPVVVIKFQIAPVSYPILVSGSWEFIEHVAKRHGDKHKFIPHSRLQIKTRSEVTVVTYIGDDTETGHSVILELIEMEPLFEDNPGLWHRAGEDLISYIIAEERCSEEDWTKDE